ncbi:MAG: hypothetical protein COA54_09630 [Thiotrichaceae bacterium]|nr:MAG: hypothetical protein COA54_09630 [Thiotrichaceae bacterium]
MSYFDDPSSKHFSFESFADGCDETTFGVISFKGYEAISKPYDFEVMLVSSNKELGLEDLLQAQAVFTIHRGENDDVLYNGILAEFDQLHEVNDVIFYRARLVPKLWWLTLTHHNQVFLDQSVPDFVEDALRDGGLETADFDLGALSSYEANSYVCQYDESHFNFVSRCLERQGIYYYFTQDTDGEVLTLTDTRFSHEALKEGSELFYNPASGLEGKHLGEAIGSFTCRQKQLPAEIILKDYNYERPSLDITSHAEVDPAGRGLSYLYGEYFSTVEEGERLANIRAEELLCKKQEFFGESTVPYIMPGFTFNMNNHYREDFNQEYLILEVTHEGNQSHLMSGGITSDSGKTQNQAIYHNSFKAIPADTQYRPQRIAKKPKISGTIHAKIDSEVDSEYAQVDKFGRYRVKLPFDINDSHIAGKGSAPIRMMQSYAGKNRGMQFPLTKGTEVLLTFIEGNPDRPVIAGAVSNPETQGPVNAENQSESVIQTGANNRIRMEDKAGSQRIVFETPAANSWIRMGTHNDPIVMSGDAVVNISSGDTAWSDDGAQVVPSVSPTTSGSNRAASASTAIDITPIITDSAGQVVADITTMVATDGIYTFTYSYVDPNNSVNIYDATRTVIVGDTTEQILGSDANGIRLHSAGAIWQEAKSRYGRYMGENPLPETTPTKNDADDISQIGDMLGYFGTKYNPTKLWSYSEKDADGKAVIQTVAQAKVKSDVEVSSLDTFTTQEGNVYDFGGCWNYNLGNGYTENHLDQCAELNKKHGGLIGDKMPEAVMAWTSVGAVLTTAVIPGITAIVASSQGGPTGAVSAGISGVALTMVGIISTSVNFGCKPMDATEIIGDVISGPGADKKIRTWADKVGSSFNSSGVQDKDSLKQKHDASLGNVADLFVTPDNYVDRAMNTDTTWVEKTFGDSYSYTQGNSIEITHGNSEEHVKGDQYEFKYGGAREETHFTGKGLKTYWSKSANGHNQEVKWDSITGQCVSYEYSKSGHFSFSVTMPTIPKLAIEIAMSSVNAKLELSAGMAINASATASLAVKAEAVTGLTANLERKFGGEASYNEVTGEMEFKAFGLKASKKAALEADKKEMELKQATLKIEKLESKISDLSFRISSNKLDIFLGQKIHS